MIRSLGKILCAALMLLPFGTVSAAPLPQAGAFTYSNQCFSRGSGDLYGLRITLLRHPGGGPWAVTYIDDEAPLLGIVDFWEKSGAIHFAVTDEGKVVTRIEGVVDTQSLRGTKDGTPITLPSISNGETKTPYCGEKK
ncbi:MAG TPA: hypothetical protein VNW15_07155 [Rhizomicrobium sp.]|jgi:hypothetical protein|nr:hypothetical protein [Rhizomicrobium sp.]